MGRCNTCDTVVFYFLCKITTVKKSFQCINFINFAFRNMKILFYRFTKENSGKPYNYRIYYEYVYN